MDDSTRQVLSLTGIALLTAGAFFLFQQTQTQTANTDVRPPGEQERSSASLKTTSGPGAHATSRRAPDRSLASGKTLSIQTEHFTANFSTLNGGLTSFRIKGARYENRNQPHEMVTTDREAYLPAQLKVSSFPPDITWSGRKLDARTLEFRAKAASIEAVRRISVGESKYQLWSTVSIRNHGSVPAPVQLQTATFNYVARDSEGGGFLARPSPELGHAVLRFDEETRREDRESLRERQAYGPRVKFCGVENAYFAMVSAPDGIDAERCRVWQTERGGTLEQPHGSLFEAWLTYPTLTVEAGQSQQLRTTYYIGPKDIDAIRTAGHELHDVVDFGWFDFIAEWLVLFLRWIFEIVGNWGVAIIVMTLIVKLALYPLTEQSFQSMAKMRLLKPELDRINELYGDDREKKSAAMMELYRKQKINPLGGCLPTLLQMPVWFALYQSLSTNVELYHAEFALWWTDLSAPDPFYVLPILLGGLMFAQQQITPTTMDPMQAKVIKYFMPLMITSFMLFLPAGLCLYMVTNSTLGIAQQRWIHHRLDKAAAEKGTSAEHDEAAATTSIDSTTSIEKHHSRVPNSSKPKSRAKRRKSRGRA
ncbi:MAG: membrane protein insertase YidC [Myxococcota bacterium]